MKDADTIYIKDRQEWRQWLQDHHDTETSVWILFDTGTQRTLSWQDIVQEALCFGWIDSRPAKFSDTQSKLYVSKRKPKSVWSKVNKASVQELRAHGQMTAAGEQAIAIAQANGAWDALNQSDALIVPPELQRSLDMSSGAKKKYDALSVSKKRALLESLYGAKTQETKAKRVQAFLGNVSD